MIIIQIYTVVSGDTLYDISNQFGINVIELANLNNVNSDLYQNYIDELYMIIF